jgi:hypothetical protein
MESKINWREQVARHAVNMRIEPVVDRSIAIARTCKGPSLQSLRLACAIVSRIKAFFDKPLDLRN